jgi:hypothetical protein
MPVAWCVLKTKKIVSSTVKNTLAYYNVEKSEVVGLASGVNFMKLFRPKLPDLNRTAVWSNLSVQL